MKRKGTKKMLSILQSLTASQLANTARIISKNGTNYVSTRQKVNAFANLYRGVSWLQIDKPDRGLKKRLNARLRFDPINSEASGDFTMSKVKAALKSFNPAKDPRPDMIHPRFLHNLDPIAVNTTNLQPILVHDADTSGLESSRCNSRP